MYRIIFSINTLLKLYYRFIELYFLDSMAKIILESYSYETTVSDRK